MPYRGIPADKVPAMDACMLKMTKNGMEKEQAMIACHKQVMGVEPPKEKTAEDIKNDLERGDCVPLQESVALREATVDAEKKEVTCILIEAGQSLNKRRYESPVLERAVPLYEGKTAYIDHGMKHSVNDVAGYWKDVHFNREQSRLEGTFKAVGISEGNWQKILESIQLVKEGRSPLVGLSHDAMGKVRIDKASKTMVIEAIESVNSVDWVDRPAAGGKPIDLVEEVLEQILEDGGEQMKCEKCKADLKDGKCPACEAEAVKVKEAEEKRKAAEGERITEAEKRLNDKLDELAKKETLSDLNKLIEETKLPEVAAKKLRKSVEGQTISEEVLAALVEDEKALVAALAREAAEVHGVGFSRDNTNVDLSEREKVQMAADGMFKSIFTNQFHGNDKGVKPYKSIRQLYIDVTGDFDLKGDPYTLRESHSRLFETIEQSDFTYIVGTSMNRALLKDYQQMPFEWKKFTDIVDVKDFKRQDLVRYGHFGALSTISAGGSYPALTEPTEEDANYTVAKRGGKVEIHWETIVDDDLRALARIPGLLAYRAAIDLSKFVYKFPTATGHSSGNIYDAKGLYHNDHNNTLAASTTLSATALDDAIVKMQIQTDDRSDRVGIEAGFVLLPIQLRRLAHIILGSTSQPDQNNSAVINPEQGIVEPIIVPTFVNQKNWYVIAKPFTVLPLQVGFLGGETPQILLQDEATNGKVFTNDIMTYRVRHIYGGAIADYRAFVKGGNFKAEA